MEAPLVSIIIITYNHKEYISQSVDSLLIQQTNFPFEIILGEDESNDGTREICIEYAHKYPDKIRLFLRSRKDCIYINGNPTGIYNFKECLMTARGKYIAICEGDDYWIEPLKLQKQVDFLEMNPDYNICFHNAIVKYANKKKPDVLFSNLEWNKLEKNKRIYTIDDLISEESLIPTASILFRNRAPIALPEWFDRFMNSDMVLFILVCGKGKIWYFDECWSIYRKHKGGVSNLIVGNFKHIMRLRMFYQMMKYFRGDHRESFTKVIRQHFNSLIDLTGLSLQEHYGIFTLFPVHYLKKWLSSYLISQVPGK